MTRNRMSTVSWKYLCAAAVCAGMVMPASSAKADLYAHWPLDDGEGDIAANMVEGGAEGFIWAWASPDSLGGTEDDPTVWVNDPVRGTVIGLNGGTQWVEAGFVPIMDLENKFTWSFWGRVPPEQAAPNNDIILGNRWGESGSDTAPREFIKFTTNRFEYHMNGGFGDDLAYADSNQPLDQWVHNSVVKDGDQLMYYRNGELNNSTTISGGQLSGETLPFGFGADVVSNGGEAWRGSLSDVQLYTSALTADQITASMGGDLAAGADLYAHYPLNDGGDSDVAIGSGPGAVAGGALISDLSLGLGTDGDVWVDDPERGTVLTFAGAFVDAGELPLMDLENDFTWNFWSNADGGQAQTSNTIIMGNRNDFADGTEWIKFTNDKIEFHADGTNASDLEWGAAGPDDIRMPNDDEWYHHTVVKDGDEMKYYRNGELRNSVSLGLGQQSPDPLPFAMGGQGAPDDDGGETSIVYLSDVRLYDNALTGAEVANLAGVVVEPTCDPNTGGDLDGSGDVGFPDFLILSANFGSAAADHTVGDIDCSGDVGFPDFLVLSANFGTTVGEAAAVPEPSSFLLLAFSSLLLGGLRRRR